jgi:trafficking protein particle complex subunit 9
MLLRLDRIVIPAEQLAKPIPSLSARQFVVSKVQQSAEDERLTRELFWYREELLRRMQATWNEVRGLPPLRLLFVLR